MRVRVNSEDVICKEGSTVLDLIRQLQLSHEKVVVERNREILAADAFATTRLAEGDTLELLQFVGGG